MAFILCFYVQFIFGAKVHEVPALREKGSAVKAPLQFSRVVRCIFWTYFTCLCSFSTNFICHHKIFQKLIIDLAILVQDGPGRLLWFQGLLQVTLWCCRGKWRLLSTWTRFCKLSWSPSMFSIFFKKTFPKVEFCMIYKGVICRPRQTKHLWIKRNGWGWVFLALPGLGDSAVIEQSRNTLRRRGESNHASVQCSIFFVGDSFEDGTNHEWTRDVCNLSIAWMKPWLVFVLYTAWHRFQFV